MSMYNDTKRENVETERIVLRILFKLQVMLEHSRQDVGHFSSLDAGRNGTEPMPTNQTENGTRPLKV